ncbi:MAG: hypothetical protein CFH06_00142 [Alphaproteobacteria bacterium MarineAlpha3_Bin5]|nr:indolepyruvate ferredoxin oxidoreductase [Magnetovibrio sp.]PPR80085.1 MAG: hypothetical protein CFH06_00142 [Alphaproteobacteria bacterium MarineAlpha3_Bin5]
MAFQETSLEDKYAKRKGRIYLNGTQALVRLALIQKHRDELENLNTAGYVTGYRGSPLGGIDREFKGGLSFLTKSNIKFHPAVNEDLAATALWGSQQTSLYPDARFDGVFGMWYGKGPGVDRSGDVFRHANLAGTSENGGVLVLAGDDPGCKSSTVPSQSEYALIDAAIPILYPASVQEILDFGILGWAMSRFTGLWIGLKCIADNIDTSGSVEADPGRMQILRPQEFKKPVGDLFIRWPDSPLDQETRLYAHKLPAAEAFAYVNKINKVLFDSPRARFGVIASGKQYTDTMQALADLGIDNVLAEKIGLKLLKIGMPWPLDKKSTADFSKGLGEILVIEEKRPVIETQLKEILYNIAPDLRPKIVGKYDEEGRPIIPFTGELTPEVIAMAIAGRLGPFDDTGYLLKQLDTLKRKSSTQARLISSLQRIPYFCSGCPHNISTKVPEGSRASAGIGCHYMAIWMDRNTSTFTHMGAEGANWIGQAPFSRTNHIFVNIGDGTYFHSGILAIRAAVAAKINVTYKILYNDAVAMTGGQSMDGPLDIPIIVKQVLAEGVTQVTIVSEAPEKYSKEQGIPKGVDVTHRNDLDQVQRRLRCKEGVSVLIYEQVCAAEKRRRRKRGTLENPPKRIFINSDVCEGCGDCGEVSNCVSLAPLETELGRKRIVDQSACNKDFSCLNGFCPSFVSVIGAEPRREKIAQNKPFTVLPDPEPITLGMAAYNIVAAGIGGTGIVTVGALLGMAAHVEGKVVSVLDVAGLAQKNGTVYSHIRISDEQSKLQSARVSAAGADLVLGYDMVTVSESEILTRFKPDHTSVIVNDHRIMTPDFTRTPDAEFPEQAIYDAIKRASGKKKPMLIDATQIVAKLLGNTMSTNVFLLGYCCQLGLLPVAGKSIERAIEINGISVDANKSAFLWGRRAAFDKERVEALAGNINKKKTVFDLNVFIQGRASDLRDYQNSKYAENYLKIIDVVKIAEQKVRPASSKLTETVARCLYKLMAYKDEYEVARLFTDGRFAKALSENFEPGAKLRFHLAPPIFPKREQFAGQIIKQEYGSWVMLVFQLLAKLKWLRGSFLDPFNLLLERRMERKDIRDYELLVNQIVRGLTENNLKAAAELAAVPAQIRGFGYIKEDNRKVAKERQKKLLQNFNDLRKANVHAAE